MFYYVAFSEAYPLGFSLDTPVSFPPASVNGFSQLNIAKIIVISTLSNLKADLSRHMTCCT